MGHTRAGKGERTKARLKLNETGRSDVVRILNNIVLRAIPVTNPSGTWLPLLRAGGGPVPHATVLLKKSSISRGRRHEGVPACHIGNRDRASMDNRTLGVPYRK